MVLAKNIKRTLLAMIVALLAVSGGSASAQTITENQAMSFGTIYGKVSNIAVTLDADGTVSAGSQYVVTPPNPRRGRYRIQGGAGTIDILVDNVMTCDPLIAVDSFTAIFNGSNFGDVDGAGIVGEAFDGNEFLELGATMTISGPVNNGGCPISFDVTATIY